MFRKIKNFALLFFLVLVTFSCDTQKKKNSTTNNTIQSISYKHTAGRGGFESITATKDSLIATSAGGMFTNAPKFNKKMNADNWEKLISAVNIKNLEKAKNGQGKGYVDGPDDFLEILTSEKEYKLVNVQDSVNSKQVNSLKTLLKTMALEQK